MKKDKLLIAVVNPVYLIVNLICYYLKVDKMILLLVNVVGIGIITLILNFVVYGHKTDNHNTKLLDNQFFLIVLFIVTMIFYILTLTVWIDLSTFGLLFFMITLILVTRNAYKNLHNHEVN